MKAQGMELPELANAETQHSSRVPSRKSSIFGNFFLTTRLSDENIVPNMGTSRD